MQSKINDPSRCPMSQLDWRAGKKRFVAWVFKQVGFLARGRCLFIASFTRLDT